MQITYFADCYEYPLISFLLNWVKKQSPDRSGFGFQRGQELVQAGYDNLSVDILPVAFKMPIKTGFVYLASVAACQEYDLRA